MDKNKKTNDNSELLEYLVDINTVHINTELPKREKILDYLRQIKNPYIYKNKGYIIEVEYNENGNSLKENFAKVIEAMINNT